MSKLTRALAELAKRADAGDQAAVEGIRAYHGSPYSFDKFSSENIGTGEGAQAFGHGLYFAEEEAVAKAYRDALKGNIVTTSDGVTKTYGQHITEVEDAIRAAHPNLNPDNIRAAAKSVVDDNLTDADVEGMGQWEGVYKSGIVANKNAQASKGSMYEVKIDAAAEDFLNWQTPLREQKKLLSALDDQYGDHEIVLQQLGLDIKYETPTGGDLAMALGMTRGGQTAPPRLLTDAGLKGVKYPAAFTRQKSPDKQSFNYVVFDDKLIDITKKYGVSIPAAAAIAAGTMTPEEAQAGPVSKALVDLAKRAVAGDTDAATEIAKYGGAGRILDQFGDPRSMDMSNLDQVPNVQQFGLERYNPPRGRPANLDPLLTDEAAQRMEGFARRGENRGGRAWYNTQPLRDEFISELGESEGAAAFDRYMDIVAATSPRSRVDANIRRSSYLYGEDRAGRPIAGLTNADFPPGYGHLAHLTQDASLKDLEGGRSFQSLDRPKTSSFAENLKGNQQPMTIDTHNFSAITGDNKNKKSPSGTQYKYLEDFQVEIANKLNMTPAQFQASVWMGAETGVADARPFLEVFDDVVARTAKRNDVSKQKALTDFIRGDAPLYGLAAVMTGGAIVPQDAQASEYPNLGGMGVRMPTTAEDEEAMLAPTGGDLMQQANRDFADSIRTQPEPDFLTSVQQQLLSGIMKTAGVADLSADVVSAMAGPLLSAPGAIARYAADRYVPGVNYSAEEMAQGRRETEDYFNYQPRTEQGPQYGEQIMQGIGGAIAPYVPAIKKAAGDSYILGAMRQGYDYLGEREKELAKALMDLSPI
jgi:hypothetical protein